ncbi:O-methyltransferase [Candidatus Woesearchaeota archaeon]|nr:O-methyltransferase [Candidatus Woesearchaeota archaeon]
MHQRTEELLKRLELKFRSLPIIPLETGNFLHILVSSARPKNILEVGTCIGYSAIWLAEAAGQHGGKVTTIEIDGNNAKIAIENFRNAKLDNITIINGDALKEIPKLNEKFDFLFIDAVKKDYINYFRLMENKLAENAIIVADNAVIFKDKMVDYLEYVRKKYRSVLVPIGTGVEMTIKAKR